jgi:PKD domain-containing protein/Big-like domain-containing protein
VRAPRRAIWLTLTLLTAITLAACARPSPTAPAPPAQTLPTVSGLSISGLPASFSYGLSVQLKAIATLSDGTQKETLEVAAVWQSSDKSVATVSDTGLLVVTGFGDADVTATFQNQEARAHVALPKPSSPPPVARLDVTLDSRGPLALAGVSEVTFDMSGSAGFGLRYDVDFGDGTSSSGASVAKHVYHGQKRFRATGTVTDGFGRKETVTREVIVISLRGTDGGYWYDNPGQEHRLRFSTDGPQVTGVYLHTPALSISIHPFSGSVGTDGRMRLVLDDQSMTLDGAIILDGEYRDLTISSGSHLLLTIHGGAADGSAFNFVYRDAY